MDMKIYAEEAKTAPKYGTTAAELLEACRRFYMDPKNEAAYSEWVKNGRKNEKDR